jgi:hypothetical protein
MVKAKEPENQGYLREHLWDIREFALRCLRWFRLFQILAGVRLALHLIIAPTRRFCGRPGLERIRSQSGIGMWWSRRDLNPRPLRCERSALPAELLPHTHDCVDREPL